MPAYKTELGTRLAGAFRCSPVIHPFEVQFCRAVCRVSGSVEESQVVCISEITITAEMFASVLLTVSRGASANAWARTGVVLRPTINQEAANGITMSTRYTFSS
jgi:hypothetical protein